VSLAAIVATGAVSTGSGSLGALLTHKFTVLHHVLSNLNAPELARVRGVSVRLRDLATSNPHWRRVLLSDLVPAYAALNDIASIPSRAWAFSLAYDGWFRAYCEVQRKIREPWLRVDADLVDGPWMVYFKHHLADNDQAGIEEPHMLITYRADNIAVSISGVPLGPRRWWLVRDDDGIVKMHGWLDMCSWRVDAVLICARRRRQPRRILQMNPEEYQGLYVASSNTRLS
jgi:hypothetical protein